MATGGGNMQALDKDVEDTTAQTDVDSGLHMAASPCSASSALSATSVLSRAAQHSEVVAVAGTGMCGHSGMQHYHCSRAYA